MIKTRLIQLLSDAKKYIVYQVILQWLALWTQIILSFTFANVLANMIEKKPISYSVVGIIFICVLCIRFLLEKAIAKVSFLASKDVKKILREKIYEKMLRLHASYKENVSTSEVVQVSTEGVEQLETYFGKYLPQLFYSLLAPLTLFILLSTISFKSAIVLLICVPLIPISIVVVQKIAKRLLNKYWSVYTELSDSFLENLQGMTTLKIYEADEEKAQQMDKESERFRNITMKVLTMQLNSTSVMDIIAYGGAAVGIVCAVLEFQNGNVNLSGCLCIILLASEFFLPLRLLGSFFHIAMNGMAASDKIFRILDLEESKDGTQTITSNNFDVVLENISFGYEENKDILHNISMHFQQGMMISLVGESGCGKSTIASLISARYRKYRGMIYIDGKDARNIEERSLLDHIVLVQANSVLCKGSVKENLLMANPSASEAEMIQALQQVKLWDFLQMQQGLQTLLEENGNNFSGGQKQRLCIARSLLKHADFYIFDEATSNIDAESEEMIMHVIHTLAKEKTVLLISHRLMNVVDSDWIYMMENGEIKEQGTHEQLLQQHQKYAALFKQQEMMENYGKKVKS